MEFSLLDSLDILDSSNLVDQIRQISIYLGTQPDLDDAKSFLAKSENLLQKKLQLDEVMELFSAIHICFSLFPNELIPILEDFIKKSPTNANYILIISSVLFYFTLNHPKVEISGSQSFISSIISEITPQLQNQNNIIKIFDKEIPQQFKNELILYLVLSSTENQNQAPKLYNHIFKIFWLKNDARFYLFL